MKKSKYEPIRSWEEVFERIDQIVADPRGNTELIKALNVNLRVETGSLPGYQGGGFAEKADSIGISKQMREKLEDLMSMDLSQDDMYLLVRQLVKSLPFFGASQDEIRLLRGLAEEIEYTFPSPITEDIRGEIHSRLSPRNLDLVRALLSYTEKGDPEPLRRINKYQKVFQYRPDKFRGLLDLLKELERQLANVFEPHPGKIDDRIEDIYQLLSNISQIVSPQINSQLRYLLGSIEKKNKSLIQTNVEILISQLDEAANTAENLNFKRLFDNLKSKLANAPSMNPDEIRVLINEWRRDAVSLFFPSLFDSLETFIGYLRSRDALNAILMLGDLRMSLRRKIQNPLLQSQAIAVTLEAVWLDLTLERIGYILFGEVNHVILANITPETLPIAIDVVRSMILNVRAKGQGTWQLEECDAELAAIKQSSELNFYTIYSIFERINAEIGAITDKTVETYYDVTRRVFMMRQIPNADEAASAFVDGLFRSTTLQHLSEITLKLLNFSRARMADLMKRVRHPPIREVSHAKVARIKRDMETLATRVDPGKLAYFFQPGVAEGSMAHYVMLGEKGAYLAEMARLGINVPPGFTLTSRVCNMFFSDGHMLSEKTQDVVFKCVERLEEIAGRALGSSERPLFLAVRAGSCVSMPGMMDTILNVGLNRETTEGLANTTGDPLFAYECFYRLVSKYASSVMGFSGNEDMSMDAVRLACTSPDEMRRMVEGLLEKVLRETGAVFPQDPREQLLGALKAIFSSWRSESAITYRQIFNIPHHFGTAANVQQMVFGNLGRNSCSGVAFSRNPVTGERQMFGEYLPCSQGEALVCGQGKPLPLSGSDGEGSSLSPSFERRFPQAYERLTAVARKLEVHLRDMQDIEFTIENNTLYVLQTRPAKRTDYAALKIAIELVEEGIIDKRTAVARLEEAGLRQLLLPVFSPSALKHLIAKGNPASPGVAVGKLAFNRSDAIARAQAGEDVILVAVRTTPKDIGGIAASRGVLTQEGGMTSHAAINSRRMAKPCVTGCQTLEIDREGEILRIDSLRLGPSDTISIDGYTGEVFLGAVEIVEPEYPQAVSDKDPLGLERYVNTYLEWEKEASAVT
ncbi:pyruvate, phosphate dikinase [Candidatus Poribacteria bacterium]|nr:pyruvate, phosphate dikinase [Candidatus Poribacteria bacterium]